MVNGYIEYLKSGLLWKIQVVCQNNLERIQMLSSYGDYINDSIKTQGILYNYNRSLLIPE